jgi:hypothetical protein
MFRGTLKYCHLKKGRKMSTGLLKPFLLLLCLNVLSITATAETPPFKKEGTLGKHLEDIYGELMQACLPEQPRILKKTCNFFRCSEIEQPVSAIPTVLQNQTAIGLESKVLWTDRQSLARIFALVYPENKFGKAPSDDAAWLLYTTGLESSERNMIPYGTTSGMVLHDCGAALTALAEANAGFDMPLAQFKTALKASYTGGTKKSVGVFFGQFDSPFFAMWSTNAPQEQQVQSMMWLYDWYSRAKYNNEYLLRSVNSGFTAFSLYEATRDSTAELDFNGAVTAGIVTAKANTAITVKNGASSNLKEFKVAVAYNATNEPDVTFSPLPSPSELVQRMRLVIPTVDEASIIPAVPGSRVTHKVTIKGMPPEHCTDNKKRWYISAKDPTSAPNLVSNKPIFSIDGIPICEFTLEYLVPGKYASQTAEDEFTLTYSIRGIYKPTDKNGTQYDADFAELAVRYPVNRSPEIFTPAVIAEPTMNGATIAWGTDLIIREDTINLNSSIDWTKTSTPNVTIVCGLDSPLTTTSTFTPNATRKTGGLNFSVYSNDKNELQNWKNGLSNLRQCTAKGTIKFPTKQAGVYLMREYSVPIHFPGATTKNVESQAAVVAVSGSEGKNK